MPGKDDQHETVEDLEQAGLSRRHEDGRAISGGI